MNNSIHIYSASSVKQTTGADSKALKLELKQRAGKTIRRIDQLTRLALVGALRCTESIELPQRTGLIMTSKYGSLNNSLSVLQEIFQQHSAPSPLKFVNTVSNAASFYVAEQLKLSANNIFIARENFALEGCLKLARQDLNSGRLDAVLVGLVTEVGQPLSVHKQRLKLGDGCEPIEASAWFLLARNIVGKTPLATLSEVREPMSKQQLIDYLADLPQPSAHSVIGASVDKSIIADGLTAIPIENRCEYSAALKISELIAEKQPLLFIDNNDKEQYSVIQTSAYQP